MEEKLIDQIIQLLQDAERVRRKEEHSLVVEALSLPTGTEAELSKRESLMRRAECTRGIANGLSIAVMVIKNKRYELCPHEEE